MKGYKVKHKPGSTGVDAIVTSNIAGLQRFCMTYDSFVAHGEFSQPVEVAAVVVAAGGVAVLGSFWQGHAPLPPSIAWHTKVGIS